MKWLFFLLLFANTIKGHSQTPDELLYNAYDKKSTKELVRFFERWNNDIPSVSDSELSIVSDTIREAYRVFTTFYRPTDIHSLGGSEWGNNIYKEADFLIVQNSIDIYFANKVFFTARDSDEYLVEYINKYFADSLKQKYLGRYNNRLSQMLYENFGPEIKEVLTDSIRNFRPRISCGSKKPLYFSSGYRKVLNDFLKNEHFDLGSGNIMTPARSMGESEQRQKFLEREIKIFYGHWGGYWQLLSYPVAYSIIFDSQMHYAKINFRMVYEGGEAILENQNGQWVLLSSRRTWIE